MAWTKTSVLAFSSASVADIATWIWPCMASYSARSVSDRNITPGGVFIGSRAAPWSRAHRLALLAPPGHDLVITREEHVQLLLHPQRTHPPVPLRTHFPQSDFLHRQYRLSLALRPAVGARGSTCFTLPSVRAWRAWRARALRASAAFASAALPMSLPLPLPPALPLPPLRPCSDADSLENGMLPMLQWRSNFSRMPRPRKQTTCRELDLDELLEPKHGPGPRNPKSVAVTRKRFELVTPWLV